MNRSVCMKCMGEFFRFSSWDRDIYWEWDEDDDWDWNNTRLVRCPWLAIPGNITAAVSRDKPLPAKCRQRLEHKLTNQTFKKPSLMESICRYFRSPCEPPKEEVYVESGKNFDMQSLIEQVRAIRKRKHKVSAIVMTPSQYDDIWRSSVWESGSLDELNELFGIPIVVTDVPQFCVGVHEEW